MKKKYLSMMIASALMTASATAWAAEVEENAVSAGGGQESSIAEYQLDDIIVTATRSEKRDVDVPASTLIITEEEIKDSGATSALDLLGKQTGLTYKASGPVGANMGTMNNEIYIRGVDAGTLVLVNGSPISWRGKYNLESISADTIERIEVIKGGGSVLYGSEAMAGVINIITKTKASNSVTVGFGNRGRQKYAVNAGTENISVHYNLDRLKHGVHVTDSDISSGKPQYGKTRTDISDTKSGNYGINWAINKNFTFMYNRNTTSSVYTRTATVSGTSGKMKAGDNYNWREYNTKQNNWQLNYKDDNGWKANLFFNDNLIESHGYTHFSSTGSPYAPGNKSYFYNTREKHRQFGVDVQKKWDVGEKSNFIVGANWKKESYRTLPTLYTAKQGTELLDFSRNIWAVFGQWEQKYDDKNSTIIGLRETFTTGAVKDRNYNNLSAQVQYLHKMNEDNNLYASIAQSFVMPSFSQMYGSGWQQNPNPNLKPQTGINYEIGWKNNHNAHSWRVALFHTRIKDNITANYDRGTNTYTYINEKFRNTGIEFSCDIKGKNNWSYNYGITIQDPKSNPNTAQKSYWDRKFGRLQLNGGISYKFKKFKANLTGSYLAYRVQTPSQAESYRAKPYFLTTFNAAYAPTDNTEIDLTIDNVLDRNDNTMHSSSDYHVAPISFLVSFTYRF